MGLKVKVIGLEKCLCVISATDFSVFFFFPAHTFELSTLK